MKTAWRPSSVWIWRVVFVGFLCLAAALLGWGANYLLTDSETELADVQFDSIADHALSSAQSTNFRKRKGTVTMATIISQALPNAPSWPFVVLNGFEEISNDLIETSDGREMALCPFVSPTELSDFETFAYDYYESKFSNETAVSSFGKGVFGINPALGTSDNRYHETDGNTSYDSPNKLFAPILHHNAGDHPALMLNLHFQETRGVAIDEMIDCAEDRATTGDLMIECGSITDMLILTSQASEPGPGAVIFQPIYPANNNTVLAGVIASSIVWDEVLLDVFAEEDSGIECVLRTAGNTYTYTITNGIVSLKGEGDLHDNQYNSFGQPLVITEGLFSESSASYSLTLYPTGGFFRTYRTSNPLVATIGAVGIILFTSLMFFIYDFLVQREMNHNHEILNAKRKFVRFISHEIRTPLNAVCMGLKVLRDEIGAEAFPLSGIGSSSSSSSSSWEPANHNNFIPATTINEPVVPTQQRPRSHSLDSDTSLLQLPDAAAPLAADSHSNALTSTRCNDWLKVVEDIVENAQGAVDVLNDLLNYGKIESGTLSFEISIIPIWSLLERVAKEFKLQARKADVKFQLDMSALIDHQGDDLTTNSRTRMKVNEMPPTIREQRLMGDNVRIIQVLRNLVSNAIKFTPEEGTVTVAASWVTDQTNESAITSLRTDRLSTEAVEFTLLSNEVVAYRRSGYVCVKVTDTGAGMTPEQVKSLFQEGVQFNVNQLQAGGGSGLGLYIAKGIAEQHGGSLVVSSPGLGQGTTFTLMLPIYNVPDDALPLSMHNMRRTMTKRAQEALQTVDDDPDDADAAADDLLSVKRHPQSLRILVVDDAASNRKMLVRLLSNKSHTCDQAKDGREAVDKVLAESGAELYDLILMDYEMPEMNGPEAAKHLRAGGCDTFIVGITGNILPEDVSFFKSCGANAVLPKPLQLPELEDLLMEYGITNGSVSHMSSQRNNDKDNNNNLSSDNSALISSCSAVLENTSTNSYAQLPV
mmetsp:Transcript_18094/g.30393  ORF Transcript_18094/g.30393 Transcript_18094/m.30393 type:complete len:987 (-) Transcript_18094:113-3073(-)